MLSHKALASLASVGVIALLVGIGFSGYFRSPVTTTNRTSTETTASTITVIAQELIPETPTTITTTIRTETTYFVTRTTTLYQPSIFHQIYNAGNNSEAMVFDPADRQLYVATSPSLALDSPPPCCIYNIAAINTTSQKETNITSPYFQNGVYSLVYDPEYQEIYAAAGGAGTGGFVIIKGTSVIGEINFPWEASCGLLPSMMAYDISNRSIYTVCFDTDNNVIYRIQPTNSTSASVSYVVDDGSESGCTSDDGGIGYDPSNNLVYTTDGCGDIFAINSSGDVVSMNNSLVCSGTCNVSLCSVLCEFTYDPSNNLVYISPFSAEGINEFGYNQFGALGCINQLVVDPCLAGSNSSNDLAYDIPDGIMFVANYYDGSVSAFNAQNELVANYTIPSSFGQPYHLSFDSLDNQLCVLTSSGYVLVSENFL